MSNTTSATATLLHSLSYSLSYLHDQLADVPPSSMTAQPAGLPNHPAWTVGHLTLTCQMIGHDVANLPPFLPDDFPALFGPGSTPSPDPTLYPPKDHALSLLRDAHARLTHAIQHLDPARLADPFPEPTLRDVFPTLHHALTQVLVAHTAYHVGQLAAWRRAMNLPPIPRSYE